MSAFVILLLQSSKSAMSDLKHIDKHKKTVTPALIVISWTICGTLQ